MWGPEEISAAVFFDQLATQSQDGVRKDQIIKAPQRSRFEKEIGSNGTQWPQNRIRDTTVRGPASLQMARETVGQHMMLFRPFFGDNCFQRFLKQDAVPAGSSPNQIEQ